MRYLSYEKLLRNTIINGNTQMSLLQFFFPGRGGCGTGYFDIKFLEISNDECNNIFSGISGKKDNLATYTKISEISHRDN